MWTACQGAGAAEPIRFGLCYDLTKSYHFITPQVAQAARDYAELINAKGGIGGRQLEITVQDHGNEPQRGLECYCLLYTSPSPRDRTRSRMPSSA